MVSVYDTVDLKLQTEITIPDRIIIGDRKQNFIISDDGKWGYIYNLSPASAVNIVDLEKRKFAKTVELPGCATLISNPGVGFSALCSDGSMATVSALTTSKPQITRTAPFFSATDDPIFENFGYDKAKKEVVLLSYTGLVYTAKLGAAPTVSQPFSLQTAAGYRTAETKPLDLAWYPGGRQPMALHKKSGQLYVLMHMGEYWSHKEGAEEIWVLDVAAKKVVRRFPIEEKMSHIEVTQDDEPKIFINSDEGNGFILDGKTGEEHHKIVNSGGGIIHSADPS
jgi:methylamine dehydrogenase heavy chain